MKMKAVKFLGMVMVAGSILTACGTAKPNGVYENGGVSLDFGNKSVTVTEGNASLTSNYEMGKDGLITFELRGNEMTCTYDKENDEINLYGETYTK